MERQIVHVTIPAFPVAVERVIHPELRSRPVVIASSGSSRSVVTALSAEAWSAGIRKGMVLSRAIRYCRSAVVLPPNEQLYLRATRALIKVLEDFSPLIELSGYGHAYLDLTGTGRLFGPPRDAAWRTQKEIRRQLHLDSSLGVASNKLVSKIASDVTRPSGLQDVPHGNESTFLSPLPVRLLPGIGPETESRLRDLNIHVIRELAAMKPEQLMLAFGRFGFLLHQRALGIDPTPVYPKRAIPALEQKTVLPEDSNDYEFLKRALLDLCERAGGQLRDTKQRAGRMELCIRYADYREERRALKLKPPSQSSSILYTRALVLLDLALKRRTRVRSLRLRLTDLSFGLVQLELFADPKPERRLKLEFAVDALRHRYGESVVVRGSAALGAHPRLAAVN